MKKKLHNGFLLVAMLLATVGSYVSCKDYDEDAYANMLGKNSKLEELVNAQVAALEEKIGILDTAKVECEKTLGTLQGQIDSLNTLLEDEYVTKEDYDKHLIDFVALVAKHKSDSAYLNAEILRVERAIAKADSALRSELVDSILKAQNELTGLFNHKIDSLAGANKIYIDDAIKNLKVLVDAKADSSEISRLEGMIEELKGRVCACGDLQSKIDTFEIRISDLKDELKNLKSIAHKVEHTYGLATADSARIDILRHEFDSLCNALTQQPGIDNTDLLNRIDSIVNNLDSAKVDIQSALEAAKENLDSANAYTDERITIAANALRGNTKSTLEDIENAYKAADEKLQEQIDTLKKDLADVTKLVEANKKKINELTGRIDKVDESLKQFITGIILQRTENPVFGSFSFPANIQTNILMAYYGYAGSYGIEFPSSRSRYYVRESEKLSKGDIEMLNLKETVKLQDGEAIVSGAGKVYVTVNPSNVNFEGQTLPIVNSLDEESGIKLSSLKYSDKKLTFGATRAAVNGFYEAEATLAAEDIDKVKMTFDFNKDEIKETVKDIINPLDGVNVTQVANTVYGVMGQFNQELDANALKASWTDSLGVSRNIYSQYNLATTAIKPLSYAFMKDANFTSFPGFDKMRNVAGKLMDKVADRFKVVIGDMPDFNFDVEHIKRIQFDKIDINTEDVDLNLVVTYKDTIETSVQINIDDYVNIEVRDSVEIEDQTITVEVPVYGEVKDDHGNVVGILDITVTEDIFIPGDTVEVYINKNVPFTWSGTVPVEVPVNIEVPVDLSELQKILNEIDGLEDEVNDLLNGQQDKVNEIIDMVNSYLDQLGDLNDFTNKFTEIGSRLDEEKDKIKDKIINYLDKIEDKLLTAVNSVNKALQPVLLVNTTSGFQKVSQTIYNPTVMSAANVQFIPTSYTAEIIAPAYKKLVGVTNVYSMDRSKDAQSGDAECLSALKEANAKEGVAEILNGDTQVVNFSAKKGYIYEVTYTSVDFSGLIAAKRFYVTVK